MDALQKYLTYPRRPSNEDGKVGDNISVNGYVW